jgi:peptide/nickel transport system substrate-binding protein
MRYRAALAIAGVLALATSCSGGDAGSAGNDDKSAPIVSGGDVVFGMASDVDILDPSLASLYSTRMVLASMCEKLYEVGEDNKIAPQLAAEMPKVSDDGLTVTIPLRQGIKFNDGTPFDAEAVKTTLDRHRELPTSLRHQLAEAVASVQVIDDHTVELTLNHPYAALPAELSDYSGNIMSPAALQKLGTDFGTAPVCVGPFKFVSRKPGYETVLKKSDQYYDTGKVHLDSITYRVIKDASVRAANLESGDIQLAEQLAPVDVQRLQGGNAVTIESKPSLAFYGLFVNIGKLAHDTPLGQSAKLREAFGLAIDREAINKTVYLGMNVTACSLLSPVSAINPEIKCPKPDPEKARELVAQSGYKTPIPVTLTVANSGDRVREAEVIQAMVKDVGFDVSIQTTDVQGGLEKARKGNYDVYSGGWTGRVDPDTTLGVIVVTDGQSNHAGFSDPQVDKLIKQAGQTSDIEKRTKLYKQALEIVQKAHCVFPIYYTVNYFGHSPDFRIPTILATGTVPMKKAGFVGTPR